MTTEVLDPELGLLRICSTCLESWPRDREFFYFRADGSVMGPCKACWAEKQRVRRAYLASVGEPQRPESQEVTR